MEYNDDRIADSDSCESMNVQYLTAEPNMTADRIMGEIDAEMERLRRLDEKKYADWLHTYKDIMQMLENMTMGGAISPMRSENEMGVHTTRVRRSRPILSLFPIFRRR